LTKRAVEYKTGDIAARQEILWEVMRDAALVKAKWHIEWVFEGTATGPLQRALTEAGIPFILR
jgi:hypothetical protein